MSGRRPRRLGKTAPGIASWFRERDRRRALGREAAALRASASGLWLRGETDAADALAARARAVDEQREGRRD